ncbi:MAG: hypothetical protein U5L07_02600 [Desulfobacterales bacterium]|nr:hypothetical protein [Desulfobacterales bacterium]
MRHFLIRCRTIKAAPRRLELEDPLEILLPAELEKNQKFPLNFFFACFDQRLNQAARLEGLESF